MNGSLSACICLREPDAITAEARDCYDGQRFIVIRVAGDISIILPGVDREAVVAARAVIAAVAGAIATIEQAEASTLKSSAAIAGEPA